MFYTTRHAACLTRRLARVASDPVRLEARFLEDEADPAMTTVERCPPG
jgi:hypothetical protein